MGVSGVSVKQPLGTQVIWFELVVTATCKATWKGLIPRIPYILPGLYF